MKGFFIEITNNLLDKKHRKAMGTAVWEFMWCLDKITKIDDEKNGWVLGGKPINLKDIRQELGITEPKISKNLNKLADAGYIEITHAPYGLVISVKKAQKRFNQKGKAPIKRGLPERENLPSKRENLHVQKGKPNKTRQLDNTVDTTTIAPETGAGKAINDLIGLFEKVNPSFERLYPNTTERKALERMVKKHTHEKIKWVIEKLHITNKMPYAPTITTPLQLERKLGNLIAFYQRKKSQTESNKIITL